MLPPACRLYNELLPLAQHERGWDDPTTLAILASYLAVLRSKGDIAGAARVLGARAAGPSAAPPPVTPRPTSLTPGYKQITMQFRRDHLLEDMLKYARLNHSAGMVDISKTWYLDTARKWYLDLLPMAEKEKGRDHPVTMGIVASLLEVFHAQGDRAAAAKLMKRSRGGVVGLVSICLVLSLASFIILYLFLALDSSPIILRHL